MATSEKKLVIGASGFLGSHVTRLLVAADADVRVMLRHNSSTEGIDDLLPNQRVERCYGDVFDDAAVHGAMAGCDVYAREKGLPAIALCVSTTYGPCDWAATPHGGLIARVVTGRFPFYLGFSSEVVGIEDASRAMLLAAEKGRDGHRYMISGRYMSTRELHDIAALMSPPDHGKAERELGWKPEPVEESVRKAARFYAAR